MESVLKRWEHIATSCLIPREEFLNVLKLIDFTYFRFVNLTGIALEILDREQFLSKHLISEMIYIKRQNNSLNLQSDTECLMMASFPV